MINENIVEYGMALVTCGILRPSSPDNNIKPFSFCLGLLEYLFLEPSCRATGPTILRLSCWRCPGKRRGRDAVFFKSPAFPVSQ